MTFMLCQVKHEINVVAHLARWQAIERYTCHITKHIRREIGVFLGTSSNFFKHQTLVVVMNLLKRKNHKDTPMHRRWA